MQIMPSGGAWTNPAALTQQSLSDSKQSNATKNAANATDPVTPLEQSGKASDRDAQERYAGPQQGNASNSSGNASSDEQESMLALPANDQLDAGILDLLG